jgi:hypothetical protein
MKMGFGNDTTKIDPKYYSQTLLLILKESSDGPECDCVDDVQEFAGKSDRGVPNSL